jgi:purine-cytosine permease-like protein
VIAVVATITIIALALIGISRALNELLDIWLTRQNAVWISYFILSFVFVAIGAWLMRRRYPSKQN